MSYLIYWVGVFVSVFIMYTSIISTATDKDFISNPVDGRNKFETSIIIMFAFAVFWPFTFPFVIPVYIINYFMSKKT